MDNKINVVCKVCGGKGGWPIDRRSPFDDNWMDCGYCEGYGFHEKQDEEPDVQSKIHAYNGYRKQIIDLLNEVVANVDSFTTTDGGKTIEIQISPYSKQIFSDFVKFVLKLSLYSTKIDIKVTQDYYCKKGTDKYTYQWKIFLQPDELRDLEGFIDVVKLWDKKGGFNA
jgi:hypothetical protein